MLARSIAHAELRLLLLLLLKLLLLLVLLRRLKQLELRQALRRRCALRRLVAKTLEEVGWNARELRELLLRRLLLAIVRPVASVAGLLLLLVHLLLQLLQLELLLLLLLVLVHTALALTEAELVIRLLLLLRRRPDVRPLRVRIHLSSRGQTGGWLSAADRANSC